MPGGSLASALSALSTALITGATGLLGSHIAERLLADGWKVRALVRDPRAAMWLAEWGVELREGDVRERESIARAAEGADVLFHAAAAITSRGAWEEYRRLNVGGTRNAIEAAVTAGARLVHISSVAVYGPEGRYQGAGGVTTEDVPLLPLPEHAIYARSKRESEELVLDAHRRGRAWATAVRPAVIYGRRDRQFVPRAARGLGLTRGIAPLPGGGRVKLAIVHAANVADGAVRAACSDVAGGRAYNMANDHPLTLAELARLAAEGLGRRLHPVNVPLWTARAAMRVLRAAGRVIPGMSVMSNASVDFLIRDNPFSSDRARQELRWDPPVRPEEGVPDAFRWWREQRTRGARP